MYLFSCVRITKFKKFKIMSKKYDKEYDVLFEKKVSFLFYRY